MEKLPIFFILMPIAILEGLFIILLSIPLLINGIKPNRFYGFCTKKTLSSSELWYTANKHAAKELVAAGMVVIMLAIVGMVAFFFVGMFTTIQAIALFIMIISTSPIIAIVRCISFLKTLY